MINKISKLLLVLPLFVLVTSACSISTTSSNTGETVDNSIFLSTTSGDTWRPMVNLPTTTGRIQTISDVNVNSLTIDPQDSLAIYLATFDRGLYFTYNITNGWNQVTSLPQSTINDVKVDPKSKCIIYAAIANRLYRSSDCTRTWVQVYYDNDAAVSVNTIAIDHYNSKNVYIGTSRGEIIKSIDSGQNWRTIQRSDKGISRLIMSPLDSRLIFVATVGNNIYSFTSNTSTNSDDSADIEGNFAVDNWTDLNDVLKDFDLGASFKDMMLSPKDGTIFLATDKLILRSPDNGITWENLKLIQPEKNAVINSVAVNPQNSNEIYYVTNTTFFHSTDGGVSWKTKNLPTKRAGRELLVDFKNPNVIYLGTIKLK